LKEIDNPTGAVKEAIEENRHDKQQAYFKPTLYHWFFVPAHPIQRCLHFPHRAQNPL
jgi:hypothetical protein